MSQHSDLPRPGHRRTHSLDLTGAMKRLEVRRNRKEQFLENRAKFNNTGTQMPPVVSPPPVPKPQTTSLVAVPAIPRNGVNSRLTSTSKLSLNPASKEISVTNTMHLTALTDEINNENTVLSPTTEQSQPVTPVTDLIQRFTSEIYFDTVSADLQPQSFAEPTFKLRESDDKLVPKNSVLHSKSESQKILEPQFKSTQYEHKTENPKSYSSPHKLSISTESQDTTAEPSSMEKESVTLRRPSDFWNQNKNSAGLLLYPSSSDDKAMIDENTVGRNRAASLQMQSMSIIDSGILETIKQSPHFARKTQISTMAVPFKPPNWVKLPKNSVDETDAAPSDYPSWIPLTTNESVEMVTSSAQPSSRTTSFHHDSEIAINRQRISSDASSSSVSNTDSKQEKRNWRRHVSASEEVVNQSIQSKKALKTSSSPYKSSTSSGTSISKWENTPKFVRRSSTSSLSSFPRRSLTPSIPVKSLVKKFSSDNLGSI